MSAATNLTLLKLLKRADQSEPEILLKTFVGTGMLEALLTSVDHQVIHGRRGTGKTHALQYLAESRRAKGDLPIYIDLRRIGSSTGIFSDETIPMAERGTRLLRDILTSIHQQFLDFAIDGDDLNLSVIGSTLDAFIDAATHVEIVGGDSTEQSKSSQSATNTNKADGAVTLSKTPSLTGQFAASQGLTIAEENTKGMAGKLRHRVNFGAIGQTAARIVDAMKPHRVWILLDEWSAIPLDIQPYVADLIRRCLLPIPRTSVKIAAIEQRSQFKIGGEQGDYIGIELGADISASLNLDDFMVFDNDSEKAVLFFQQLIFNHYGAIKSQEEGVDVGTDSAAFIAAAFTQRNAFEELVRAAEGVPRDAINIIGLCAQKAGETQISIPHVRVAASMWYQRDKESSVSVNLEARELLHWIINEVIAHRRARAFLIKSDIRNPTMDSLFDARVIHLLKRNISSHDDPGQRYDVYKIDYGSYVDLTASTKAPLGLLPAGDDDSSAAYVDVPPDDYRAIRRAILDLGKYFARPSTQSFP